MYTVDIESDDLISAFEPLAPDAIALSPEAMNRSLALAQRSPQTDNQWQIYLTALALNGFEQWLRDRASDLTIQQTYCTILSSPVADATTAACNLQVNGFQLCLMGTESIFDGNIAIPAAALDSPDCIAHFYVPIEVQEEQGTVFIRGFLRYDQWQHHQASAAQQSVDGTYRLPMAWFEPDINRLLLHLSCLDQAAIALPAAPVPPKAAMSAPLRQLLAQPAIGVGRWLRQQWEAVAEDLNGLLTPVEATGAMRGGQEARVRSPNADFATLIKTLERSGRSIPSNLQGMYRDWIFANHPLRLYVATAPMMEPQTVPNQPTEWSLLIILTTQHHMTLPVGIRLQVSDGQTLLGEQILTDATSNYLYLTAIGTVEEQFIVTIALADGTALTLPPFRY